MVHTFYKSMSNFDHRVYITLLDKFHIDHRLYKLGGDTLPPVEDMDGDVILLLFKPTKAVVSATEKAFKEEYGDLGYIVTSPPSFFLQDDEEKAVAIDILVQISEYNDNLKFNIGDDSGAIDTAMKHIFMNKDTNTSYQVELKDGNVIDIVNDVDESGLSNAISYDELFTLYVIKKVFNANNIELIREDK